MHSETKYLSSEYSVYDNLKVMVENNTFTTKEFEKSIEDKKSQNFSFKLILLKISTVAVFCFAALATHFKNIKWGVNVSLASIIPIFCHQILKNRKQQMIEVIKEEDKNLSMIYNQILELFKKHIYFKEEYLIKICDEKNMVKQDFDFLTAITTNYNYNRANYQNENSEDFMWMRKEYSDLRVLAKAICMKEKPPLIYERIWNKFKSLCLQLSYGRRFCLSPITFVELYKTDNTTEDLFNFAIWKARKWRSA